MNIELSEYLLPEKGEIVQGGLNVPFDFDSFTLIDDGVCYLNPKHFSVARLIEIMESTNR